jgi:heme o synthase
VRQRDEPARDAKLSGDLRSGARDMQHRRAGLQRANFDVGPADAPGPPRAQGFQGGFLRSKASREMLGSTLGARRGAGGLLVTGEALCEEARAVVVEHPRDAGDLDQIYSMTDDAHERPSIEKVNRRKTSRVRFERTTCRLEGGCSIQLSYQDPDGSSYVRRPSAGRTSQLSPRSLRQASPRLEANIGVMADSVVLSALPATSARARLGAAYELTKPRITRMVVLTAGVGFMLAAMGQSWELSDLVVRFLGCVIGTALASSGANALNQWWERARDAQMPRTAHRPLPQGRLSPAPALAVGLSCSLAGSVALWTSAGPAAAAVALATILIYVLCYTPLKPVTTLNTVVGAVPGALPPLIGWCAACSGNALAGPGGFNALFADASLGGWSLFALMFVWQIPHVLALAWMYKDDYAKGGYRMLPIVDPTGQRTAATMTLWAVALVPASLLPIAFIPQRLGWIYGIAAIVGGLVMCRACIRVWRSRADADARKAFICSVIHLPVLLAAMMVNAVISVVL